MRLYGICILVEAAWSSPVARSAAAAAATACSRGAWRETPALRSLVEMDG